MCLRNLNTQYPLTLDSALFLTWSFFSTKAHETKRVPRIIKYRLYGKFDEEKFVTDLSRAPFQVAELFDDVNDSYWFCNDLLKDLVDEHAPMKQRTCGIKHNQVALYEFSTEEGYQCAVC